MNINTKLDLLKQIKQVDTPPFLLTRIRQRIDNLSNVEAPVKWKWAFAASAILILALNVSIFFKHDDTTALMGKNDTIENVVNSLNLTTSNNFYNE